MTVSVAVMAHPRRKAWAESVASEFDCPIVWDEQNSMWDTGRRALLAGVGQGTHHLVIQDDTIPSEGLAGLLPQLVKPGPVSLYAGNNRMARRAMELSRKLGYSWWRYIGLVWGPAVITPTEHLEPLVAYGDRMTVRSYDQRLTAYWKRQQVACWYTAPSLVNHRRGGNPSLKGGPDTRDAWWYGSGVGVDWSGGALMMDRDTLSPVVTFTDGQGRARKVRYGTSIYRRLSRNDQWELTPESQMLVELRTVDV